MSHFRISALALLAVFGTLAGCKDPGPSEEELAAAALARQQEVARLNQFFDLAWEERLAASPQLRSRLGQRIDYDKWDDLSDDAAERRQEQVRQTLIALSKFDYVKLDPAARLSYELFEEEANRRSEQYRWRQHHYLVDQQKGLQASVPAFLIASHPIRDESDALAYIARLRGIQPLFQQAGERLKQSETLGVIPPRFVFPLVATDIRNVLRGQPFDRSREDSVLLKDFRTKIAAIDLPEERRKQLEEEAATALVESVKPAYESLAMTLRALEKKATMDDGVWKLPNGVQYYRAQVRWYTTTDLTPEEAHQLGLVEVERVQNEIRALMPALDFSGTLPEFFRYTSRRSELAYSSADSDTETGRDAPLTQESQGLPEFRKHFPAPGYVEGWRLYAERLAKENGDAEPASEYRRLATELVSAVRLVVDTGIHAKQWTRNEAIQYHLDNTPLSRSAATAAVERSIVYPGQATAGMVGLLRFVQLREQAMEQLGANFDSREFHAVILGSGPVSFNVLQRLVNRYVEDARGRADENGR